MRTIRLGALVVLAALAAMLSAPRTASAATLVVPTSYQTINAALAAARAGDTIEVLPGTYQAEIVVVAKAVSIVGAGSAQTSLGASLFDVYANGVVLRGFTMSGTSQAVIVRGSASVIEDLTITGGGVPALIYGSGNVIRGSRFTGAGIPLPIYGSDNLIEGNVFDGNGIPMPVYGPRNQIVGNVFTNSSIAAPVYGPSLTGGPGVWPFGPGENTIVGNTFEDGPILYSDGNTVYQNNFLDDEARSDPTAPANAWDDGAGQGNHWARYRGIDNGTGVGRYGEPRIGGDGIGDTDVPYRGLDWYPFLRRDGWIDSGPPDTAIDSTTDLLGATVPQGGSTTLRSLRVGFSGSDDTGVASFECSVDGSGFWTCESPLELTNQALGPHHVEVRAIDLAGKRDPSPATFGWTVVTARDALGALVYQVGELPGEAFTTRGGEEALGNALQAALAQSDRAGNNACGAIEILARDVLRKVDGETSPEDWVRDPHRQALEDAINAILMAMRDDFQNCP